MAKQKRDPDQNVRDGVRVKAKAAPADFDPDEDEDEAPRSIKKKKKKKKKSSNGMLIGIGAAVAVLLVIIICMVVFFATRPGPRPVEVAQVQEKKVEPAPAPPPIRIIPRIEEGNPAVQKKGGTGIVNNVRGAGYRTERRSELKQIGLAFVQFSDEYKGAGRTLEAFLDNIKTYGPIRDAVKDGYYKMNMNARLEHSSVIAYERDIDAGMQHLCVRGDGNVDYVPLDELKTILGRDP